MEPTGVEQPVFVLATGWRSGSTLLQRLLNSHPDILIWGENNSAIELMERARVAISGIQTHSQKQLASFRSQGSRAWIAVMNPPADRFDAGLRSFLETYYRDSARELGRSRWGFKEVRYGARIADFLLELYPTAKFLLLVRHPVDCLASARGTEVYPIKAGILSEVGGVEDFLNTWSTIAESFSQVKIPSRIIIKYENLIKNQRSVLCDIASFLGARSADFDDGVFRHRRRGWLGLPPRLTLDDKKLLMSEKLWKIASKFDYDQYNCSYK